MKKDNEKKNKIKNILKKIGKFLWNGLAVWGIVAWILLIVGGCISLNQLNQNEKQNQVTEVINKKSRFNLNYKGDNYKYVLMPNSGFPTSWDKGFVLVDNVYVPVISFTNNSLCTTEVNGSSDSSIRVYLKDCVAYLENNTYLDYNTLGIETYYNANDNKCYLTEIYLRDNNSHILQIYHYARGGYINPVTILCNDFQFQDLNIQPLPNRRFEHLEFLKIFFLTYESEDINYSFNNYNINPIQYYSYEIMNDNTAHNVGSYTGHIDLDMKFVSNGMSFKKMRFQYDYVLGTYYNNELTTYDNMTYLSLSYIAYQKTYNDEWVKVCYPRIYKYETRTLNNVSQLAGYPFTDFNSYLWANDGYKDITIVNGVYNVFSTASGDPIANLNNIQVLTYQGEMNNTAVDISNTNNVFVLLGEGFSSVASLFGIILLPGITIGTLLFLPLVVAIVLAIIKLLRK